MEAGRLTRRQEIFCVEFVRCGNASKAYKRAGYKEKGARENASRLITKHNIKARIAELQAQIDDEKIMDATERRETLTGIARDSGANDADRIKAIDTMNKMDGVYLNRTELSGRVDTGDIVIRFSDERDDGQDD